MRLLESFEIDAVCAGIWLDEIFDMDGCYDEYGCWHDSPYASMTTQELCDLAYQLGYDLYAQYGLQPPSPSSWVDSQGNTQYSDGHWVTPAGDTHYPDGHWVQASTGNTYYADGHWTETNGTIHYANGNYENASVYYVAATGTTYHHVTQQEVSDQWVVSNHTYWRADNGLDMNGNPVPPPASSLELEIVAYLANPQFGILAPPDAVPEYNITQDIMEACLAGLAQQEYEADIAFMSGQTFSSVLDGWYYHGTETATVTLPDGTVAPLTGHLIGDHTFRTRDGIVVDLLTGDIRIDISIVPPGAYVDLGIVVLDNGFVRDDQDHRLYVPDANGAFFDTNTGRLYAPDGNGVPRDAFGYDQTGHNAAGQERPVWITAGLTPGQHGGLYVSADGWLFEESTGYYIRTDGTLFSSREGPNGTEYVIAADGQYRNAAGLDLNGQPAVGTRIAVNAGDVSSGSLQGGSTVTLKTDCQILLDLTPNSQGVFYGTIISVPLHSSGFNIDRQFLAGHEGNQHTVAYSIALSISTRSGVTVATGVDLGYRSERELRSWGATDADIALLGPYLGLTGQAAIDYLAAHPLTVSQRLADLLDEGAFNSMVNGAAHRFDGASDLNFRELPREAQTVLVDMYYHYANGAPRFWGFMEGGDWAGAIAELRNFGDGAQYVGRHNDQANLLQQALDAGRLP